MKFSLPFRHSRAHSQPRVTRLDEGGFCLRWQPHVVRFQPSSSPPSSSLHGRRRRFRPLQRPRPSHDVHLRMRPGPARMQSRRLPVLRQRCATNCRPRSTRAEQRRPHPARLRAGVRANRHRRAHHYRLQPRGLDHALPGPWRSASPSRFTSCARGRTAPNPPSPMASSSAPGNELDEFRRKARKETDL